MIFFQVGWYSESEGLHLIDSALPELDTSTTPRALFSSALALPEEDRSTFARAINNPFLAPEINSTSEEPVTELASLPLMPYESFISRKEKQTGYAKW